MELRYMYIVKVDSPTPGNLQDQIPSVQIKFDITEVSVRTVIESAVEAQVAKLNEQSSLSNKHKIQILNRQFLTDQDIDFFSKSGKITRDVVSFDSTIDGRECVLMALRGFKCAQFVVIANGVKFNSLDDKIVLLPNTKIQFIRLVPLTGK